jgi:hypothetical protein
MTPQDLAARLTGQSASRLHDSVVTGLTQSYLDAMAAERAAQSTAPVTNWTVPLGGNLVGLDSRYIHIGPLKVPTILLALLPINLMANPTEADRARKFGMMREDLMIAAQRSANLSQFKAAVKQLREEREADREFRQNQRRTPPPVPEDPQ